MNFPSQVFFNEINHGYKAAILKENSLWLLPFYMVVATYFYSEKYAEWCALQLYQSSLKDVTISRFRWLLLQFLEMCISIFLWVGAVLPFCYIKYNPFYYTNHLCVQSQQKKPWKVKVLKVLNWRYWRRSGVFIVNFEHISYLFLVFLFLTLNFEQVNVSWEL